MTAILERRESESLWGRFCNCKDKTEEHLGFTRQRDKKRLVGLLEKEKTLLLLFSFH
jgi:hypothetical protein